MSNVFQQAFDAYARFMQIDAYPNQPEIVEWPMTELEKVEMDTLQALACMKAKQMAAEAVAVEARTNDIYQAIGEAIAQGREVTITIK